MHSPAVVAVIAIPGSLRARPLCTLYRHRVLPRLCLHESSAMSVRTSIPRLGKGLTCGVLGVSGAYSSLPSRIPLVRFRKGFGAM